MRKNHKALTVTKGQKRYASLKPLPPTQPSFTSPHSMAFHNLLNPDFLPLLLRHLTRQDAAILVTVCKQAADSFSILTTTANASPLYTPAARVIICASGSRQLLVLPLTRKGEPYVTAREDSITTRSRSRSATSGEHSDGLQAVNVCTGASSKRE